VPLLPTGANLGASLQANAQWILDNVVAGLADNGTVIADGESNEHFFLSPTGRHGTDIAAIDATAEGLGESLGLFFLSKDPSRPTEAFDGQPSADELLALSLFLGDFSLSITESEATLSFQSAVQPIPLPAAVWLFGAGVAGLAGFGRRRT